MLNHKASIAVNGTRFEEVTSICSQCKNKFTHIFVWFLSARKRCDECCKKNPRQYKQ